MTERECDFMGGRIGIRTTLDEVFSIYREQAGILIPVAFWIFLLVAIANGVTEDDVVLSTLVSVVSLGVSVLYQGMVVGLVEQLDKGRRDYSVGELVRSVSPVLLTLAGAAVITAIGIGFGFMLLLVPGLYLLTIWFVVAPVVVVERRGVFDALGRSRQLVRGNGWRVLGLNLILAAIVVVAFLLFLAIVAAIVEGVLTLIVVTALSSALIAPVQALLASVLYFRLLELQAEPASVPQQPGDSLG